MTETLTARLERVTQGPNHKWWALLVVQSGILMATIDGSIVNVGLPTIMHAFGVGIETVEWVVIAYLLTISISLLPFGRLADMLGRKRVVLAGYTLFTIGSALCGLAPTVETLIGARIMQALGAACLMANGMAITSAVFPARERGKALGINGTVVATGTTIGPTLGGFLIQTFGWHSIFLVNVPIGIAAVALGALVLREERISAPQRPGQRFDALGAALAAVGIGGLVLGLERVATRGAFDAPSLALVAVGAVALVAFALAERRVPQPLLDLALFRVRAFNFGTLAALLSFVALSTNIFLMPFYLQLVLGFDPLQAGLMLTPVSLMLAVVAPIAGRLSDRVGSRLLTTIGLSSTVVGLFWLSTLRADSTYPEVFVRLLLLGAGSGLFQSPNSSAVLGAVPRERLGIASGLLSAMRNLGMVLGTSASAAILAGGLAAFGGMAALREAVDPAVRQALLDSYLLAQRNAYLLAAAVACIGVALAAARGSGIPASRESLPAILPAARSRLAPDTQGDDRAAAD